MEVILLQNAEHPPARNLSTPSFGTECVTLLSLNRDLLSLDTPTLIFCMRVLVPAKSAFSGINDRLLNPRASLRPQNRSV